MKYFLNILILLVCTKGHAISCNEHDRYSQSIKEHIALASEVFLGTVTEAKYDIGVTNGSEIHLKVKVHLVSKGTQEEYKHLSGSIEFDRPITIGFSYIFFSYGDSKYDSVCGYLIEAGPFTDSVQDLEHIISQARNGRYGGELADVLNIQEFLAATQSP